MNDELVELLTILPPAVAVAGDVGAAARSS
jgi:hypothetical protein